MALLQHFSNNCSLKFYYRKSLKNHTEILEISNLTSFCTFIQFIMSQKSWEPKLRNSFPLFAIYWTFTKHFTKIHKYMNRVWSVLKRFVHFAFQLMDKFTQYSHYGKISTIYATKHDFLWLMGFQLFAEKLDKIKKLRISEKLSDNHSNPLSI